jgi:hypothetical protein
MSPDAVDFWLATVKDGTAALVPKANARTADASRRNRSTERVCTEEGLQRRFSNPRSRHNYAAKRPREVPIEESIVSHEQTLMMMFAVVTTIERRPAHHSEHR